MKLAMLSSASVMGLLAAIGQTNAAPDMTGVLELSGGIGTTDQHNFFVGKGADDPYFYGGKAKGYWPLSSEVHLQIDIFAQQTNQLMVQHGGEGWPSTDATADGAAIHLLHPIGEYARVGVAGSIWDNEVFDITNSSRKLGVTYGLAPPKDSISVRIGRSPVRPDISPRCPAATVSCPCGMANIFAVRHAIIWATTPR